MTTHVELTEEAVLQDALVRVGGSTLPLGSWIGNISAYQFPEGDEGFVAYTTVVPNIVIDGIGEFRELTIDSLNRPTMGLDTSNGVWAAVDGEFTRIGIIPSLGEGGTISFGGEVSFNPDALDVKKAPTIDNWAELTTDIDGRPTEAKDKLGQIWMAIGGVLTQVTSTSSVSVKKYNYNHTYGTAFPSDSNLVYLVMVNGQSLAAGAKNGSSGDATITTTAQHPGFALMPSVGTRPNGALFGSLVDLYEQNIGGSFETVASGMADVIMTRLQARLGYKPQIIFANASYGGQAYWDTTSSTAGLKRGTAIYTEAIRVIEQCAKICKAAGKTLVVLGQVIIHGEQDFANGLSKELYGRALDQWNAHINEDWRALTGQASPIRTYLTQVNRGGSTAGSPAGPALAQLAAQDRNPMIRCVGAFYGCAGGVPEDGNDGSHLQAIGYRHLGCLIGHFLIEDLLGAYEQPIRVVDSYWYDSTRIRVKFSKSVALETDNTRINVIGITVGATTYVGLGNGKGIEFTDGSGSPPAITGVVMVGGENDTIQITLASAPTGLNPRLTIAALRVGDIGSGAGRGARSAIRSLSAFHTDALTSSTLYHWACQEQVKLPIQ